MKKLNLDKSKLKLKKEEVSKLSTDEMKQVFGGETGPCTSIPCHTNPEKCEAPITYLPCTSFPWTSAVPPEQCV